MKIILLLCFFGLSLAENILFTDKNKTQIYEYYFNDTSNYRYWQLYQGIGYNMKKDCNIIFNKNLNTTDKIKRYNHWVIMPNILIELYIFDKNESTYTSICTQISVNNYIDKCTEDRSCIFSTEEDHDYVFMILFLIIFSLSLLSIYLYYRLRNKAKK